MPTPIADMVEQMLSTGIPPELIVLAVRTAEINAQPIDHAAERRRAWDRERKRKDRACPVEFPPDAILPVSLFKERKKESGKVRTRGTRLAEDWQPDTSDCTYAIDHGLDPKTTARDFRDYWHARAGAGAVKMDWRLTWQRWCRTEQKQSKSKKPQWRSGIEGVI